MIYYDQLIQVSASIIFSYEIIVDLNYNVIIYVFIF